MGGHRGALSLVPRVVPSLFETGVMLAQDTRFPNFSYGSPYRVLRDAMMAGD